MVKLSLKTGKKGGFMLTMMHNNANICEGFRRFFKGDFLSQILSLKEKVAWSVITYKAGLELENDIIFPVKLSAVYVPGKWSKIVNNKKEFRELLRTGLRLSPVFEVVISWKK